MNILLFSHRFYPDIGGIESVSLMLANNFVQRQDVSLLVVTRTREEGNNQFPFRVARDPSIIEIISLLKWSDVVFENNPCFGLSWPNLLFRKPKIVALHTWITAPNEKEKLKNRLKKKLLNDYNAVVACSNKIKDVTYNKALVIENAYDSNVFKQNQIDKAFDFIFVGRLVSDKGADMCVELLAELLKTTTKKFSLTIIGDGPEMKNLQELAANFKLVNQIRFLGFLASNEIAKELNAHRYLLVPSRWEEPFGIVALEGLACGCIPIVSDGGGLPDAVGKAGLVFKRNSIQSLVSCTLQLLENVKQQNSLLASASEHLSQHKEEQISERYFSLLLNAVKKNDIQSKLIKTHNDY